MAVLRRQLQIVVIIIIIIIHYVILIMHHSYYFVELSFDARPQMAFTASFQL